MKLVDMKLPKKDKKNQDVPVEVGVGYNKEEYPYGLCINLGNDQIDKLGIFDDMDVDLDVVIQATGTIKGKNNREMQGGKSDKSLEIQIKSIAIESAKPLEEASMEEFVRRRNKR